MSIEQLFYFSECAVDRFVFRKDNVSCVEALIQASNRETNDDDVEGRTPLLTACINGHHLSVQTLLLLGGDITMR
jgi:ankyrin repeat protein